MCFWSAQTLWLSRIRSSRGGQNYPWFEGLFPKQSCWLAVYFSKIGCTLLLWEGYLLFFGSSPSLQTRSFLPFPKSTPELNGEISSLGIRIFSIFFVCMRKNLAELPQFPFELQSLIRLSFLPCTCRGLPWKSLYLHSCNPFLLFTSSICRSQGISRRWRSTVPGSEMLFWFRI